MIEPEIEITCPFCQSNEVVIVDIIAGNNPPLPDIVALDCKKCGRTGSGYQDSKGWKIDWDDSAESQTNL